MSGLTLQQLSRRSGDRVLLEGLDLAVAPGECLALLGPSGCGKTTTLRLVAGLDPCSSGRILLGGEDITHRPAGERQVAMVFQSYALFPHLDVGENLALGLRTRGVPRPERDRRIAAVLELLELGPLVRRRPAQLSGGQRQRVALARALLRQPRIVLLDEPMSNLDARLREDLRPELRRLLCGGEPPVLYVTHDQQEAMGLADRIAVLESGVLQQVGTPQELYHRPANLFVARFLGRPGINLLAGEAGVQLGIRPEQLRLVESGGLPARLLRREWQGSQQLLWLDTSRGELLLLAEASLSPGEQLQVSWRPEDELRFSSASGERLA